MLSAAQGAQLHRLGVAPAVEELLRQCPEPEEVFCAAQPRADDGEEEEEEEEDGGGGAACEWVLLFRQSYIKGGEARSKKQWLEVNAHDEASADYSVLRSAESLERFRDARSGLLHLRLRWPQRGAASDNVWAQRSNPLATSAAGWGVEGYRPKRIAHASSFWGGLELNSKNGESLMDGSTSQRHGHWFYPIGYTRAHTDSMPTFAWDVATSVTELYVRVRTALDGRFMACLQQRVPRLRCAALGLEITPDTCALPPLSPTPRAIPALARGTHSRAFATHPALCSDCPTT